MSTITENITPARAQEYLRTSVGNRPISKMYVRSYADTMRKGKWMLNGVPIIFDVNGHLTDGHHRLEAVIEAGIPVAFDVCRGVPEESFTTYDNGRHRTVGQILAMQGVKHYNLVGAIIVANEKILKFGRLYENNNNIDGSSPVRRTNEDAYNAYREDNKGYDDAAEFIVHLASKCRIIHSSWTGGLYYFLTHTGGYTHAEVAPFFEALYNLDGSEIPVVDMLRKAITKEALEGRKMQAETLWAFLVKAWNSYITGTAPKFLRYQGQRETLPQLILK